MELPDPVAAIASLDEPNRRRLYDFVVGRHEPVGRDEAAAEAGMSRELAAFHLDRLVAAGLLETEYKRLGGAERPGCRPAGQALSAIGSRSQRVVAAARLPAGRAPDGRGPRRARWLRPCPEPCRGRRRSGRGKADGLEARRNAGPRASRRRLRSALVELLRRAGYAPEVTTESGRIGLRSCPFDGLVTTHRDLTCGMNVAWAEGVLDGLGQAGLRARLDPADGFCCVAFDSAPAHRATPDATHD